jgi:hypothetical protein
VDEITDEGIDGQHAFGLELAQGNMERPLVVTRRALLPDCAHDNSHPDFHVVID